MKKILIIASVVKSHINTFHLSTIKMLNDMGFEVHVAARNDFDNKKDCVIPYCEKFIDIDFKRNLSVVGLLKAMNQMNQLLEEEKYSIIHCNTPIPSALLRTLMISKKRLGDTKIIYEAHGFHFFKGSSLKSWLLFYPTEFFLSKYTDSIITINQEDFLRAHKFNAKNIYLVHGVGVKINYEMMPSLEKKLFKQKLNVPKNNIVFLSVGELNENKNQILAIRSLGMLKKKISNFTYIICGEGNKKKELQKEINKLGLNENVLFLGYRNDISKINQISDIFIFPSIREGLPLSVMEALSVGTPVIASNIRGNKDLIKDEFNGLLFKSGDEVDLYKKICELLNNESKANFFRRNGKTLITKYSQENVLVELKKIYMNLL